MSSINITVNVDEYLALNKYEVDEETPHIELVDDPDDRDFLERLLNAMVDELPEPKPGKSRSAPAKGGWRG